jgi:hypothetical protein
VQKARPALRTWEKSSPLSFGVRTLGRRGGLGGEEGVGEAVASHKEQKSLSAILGQIMLIALANSSLCPRLDKQDKGMDDFLTKKA